MPKHPSSGKYAIVGLGVIAGNQPDKSERMIAAEAARLAIEDAGLARKDIGGAIDLRRTGGGGERASYSDAFPRVLGLGNIGAVLEAANARLGSGRYELPRLSYKVYVRRPEDFPPVEQELRLMFLERNCAYDALVEAGRQTVGFDIRDEAVPIFLADERFDVL